MNKLQKCIATGAVAWLAVVVPATVANTLGSSIVWNLSYSSPLRSASPGEPRECLIVGLPLQPRAQ